MSFLETQWKTIVGVVVLLLVVGLGVVAKTTMNVSAEKKAQENFFLIEKKYSDYKTKKAAPPEAKDPKAKTAAVAPDLSGELATVKKDLESFLATDSSTKAGQMAALYYAEILINENKKDAALAALQKAQNNDSGLVNTLVQQQLGQVLADLDKCADAITVWQKVVDRKQAAFLHNDVKIQQALCYQKTNDLKKAEELLTNIANQKPDSKSESFDSSSSVKEAAKYLRLIQFKKVSGT